MNEELPKNGDYVDWEKIRQSEEYKSHILFYLHILLVRMIIGGMISGNMEDVKGLQSIESFRHYCEEHNYNIDIDNLIKEIETHYIADQKWIAEIKSKFSKKKSN